MSTSRVQDARAWLQTKAGWSQAAQLIQTEARVLRVDPTSDAALRHAIATYTALTGEAYPRFTTNTNHQGELL